MCLLYYICSFSTFFLLYILSVIYNLTGCKFVDAYNKHKFNLFTHSIIAHHQRTKQNHIFPLTKLGYNRHSSSHPNLSIQLSLELSFCLITKTFLSSEIYFHHCCSVDNYLCLSIAINNDEQITFHTSIVMVILQFHLPA